MGMFTFVGKNAAYMQTIALLVSLRFNVQNYALRFGHIYFSFVIKQLKIGRKKERNGGLSYFFKLARNPTSTLIQNFYLCFSGAIWFQKVT